MVKQIQTIRGQFAETCFSVFDHFVGLALKGLISVFQFSIFSILHVAIAYFSLRHLFGSLFRKVFCQRRIQRRIWNRSNYL